MPYFPLFPLCKKFKSADNIFSVFVLKKNQFEIYFISPSPTPPYLIFPCTYSPLFTFEGNRGGGENHIKNIICTFDFFRIFFSGVISNMSLISILFYIYFIYNVKSIFLKLFFCHIFPCFHYVRNSKVAIIIWF